MKGPSLQQTAALSAVLHLTVFILSALILKQSSQIGIPSPYIVSLVGPSDESGETSTEPAEPAVASEEIPDKDVVRLHQEKTDDKLIKESIDVLKKMKEIGERVKNRERVSIKGKGEKTKRHFPGEKGRDGSVGGLGTAAMAGYRDKIINEIRNHWFYPDTTDRTLETTVSAKIIKDGTIMEIKREKSSGNRTFDNSAEAAVRNASPVTPPPFETEIEIRFYP